MSKNASFQEGASSGSPIEPATCKTCGAEIFSGTVARQRLGNGATYLYPPKTGTNPPFWAHRNIGNMILNGEATFKQLENDPEFNHNAEPADGRTHAQDYEYHALKTKLNNIARGVDPRESMELAMKEFNTAYDIGKNGFGVV